MSEKKVLVRIRGLAKDYKRGVETVHVLEKLDLDIREGDFLALMGPSGSGKSTLLNLIGGLDRPSSGTLEVAGQRVDSMGDGALARTTSASSSRCTTCCRCSRPSATSSCRCC